MKYVDKDIALKYLANSEIIFNKIKASFLSSYKNAAQEIHQMISSANMDDLYRYIHSIKGISLNLGSTVLFEDCHAILDKIKREEDILPDIDRFIFTLRNVISELESL